MSKRTYTSRDDSADSQPGTTKENVGDVAYLFRKSSGIAHQLLIMGHGIAQSDSDFASTSATVVWLGPDTKLLSVPSLSQVLDGTVGYHSTTPSNQRILNYTISKWPGHNPLRDDTYGTIKFDIAHRKLAIDVLSIRNRWHSSSIKLADVFSLLRDRRYNYGHIVCQFCRGRAGTSMRNDHTPYDNPKANRLASLPRWRNFNV